MCKTKYFEKKQDKMMNEYENCYITYSGTGLGAGEFNSLIVIAYPKRKSQDSRSDISNNEAGSGIYPAAVFKNINAEPKQETQENKKRLISRKRKEDDKKNVQVRINIPEEINIVKHQDLYQHQDDEPDCI